MDFPRRTRRRSRMELTPLIDVVFQLLVFFLLTSSFLQPSLRLELPRGVNVDEADATPILLEIDREGALSLDGEAIERSNLRAALARALAEGRRAVRLSGDHAMGYGLFIEALDAARSAGAAHFDLVHSGSAAEAAAK
ncbi:MAG: biopolymer transporter ExbD [Planctomycetota bacterium]